MHMITSGFSLQIRIDEGDKHYVHQQKSRRIIKVQTQFEQHSDNRWIVIIDRTLNRNSDRVITLFAAAPRD
ncbi:hypothetical protein HanPI659440_Chr09g0318641 [Helianthus annuus]|nr:hypothetical protein HanPI659440_Chr09g0318641 [Helianthus annuus]